MFPMYHFTITQNWQNTVFLIGADTSHMRIPGFCFSILTEDTPYLACEGELWGIFCEYNFWTIWCQTIAVMYAI